MDDRQARADAFERYAPAWLVVRHLLPAGLLLELIGAIVARWSGNALALDDIARFDLSEGEPVLASLAFRPLRQTEPLPSALKNLIQLVVWQGDQTLSPTRAGPDGDPDNLAALEAAMLLSRQDLAQIERWPEDFAEIGELAPMVSAMQMLAGHDAGGALPLDDIESELEAYRESPLSILALKHLGDLAADLDRWEAAGLLYRRAGELLEALRQEGWDMLLGPMKTIVAQSLASALRTTDGPGQAAALLDELIADGGADDPLPMLNAGFDALAAHLAADKIGSGLGVERGSVLLAPQLIGAHQPGYGLGNALEGRHSDAHRWFWAVLRRQIGLGSAAVSRDTRAAYARSIIDELLAGLGRHHNEENFKLAVRLLLESGRQRAADAVPWDARLVATYVNGPMIDAATTIAARHRGALHERQRVLIALIRGWAEKLAPSRTDVALRLIDVLAELIEKHDEARPLGGDLRREAIKALRTIGDSRPEFTPAGAERVARALLAQLDGPGWVTVMEAVEAVEPFVAELPPDLLAELVERVLALIGEGEETGGSSPLLRSALNLLSNDRILSMAKDPDDPLGRRVAVTMVRLTLETGTEHRRLMYLLRYLGPAAIDAAIDRTRLDEVVAGLAQGAGEVASSAAAGCVQALLVAPAVSGKRGIIAALDGLAAILDNAVGQRFAFGAADAYDPLLQLAGHHEEIARMAGLESGDLLERMRALEQPIVALWTKAADEPAIFNGFTLPLPTEPNRVIVHNWTFASLAFGRAIGRVEAIEAALAKAEANDALRAPMETARAVRTSVDGAPFDIGAIAEQEHEGFYAALGERLVLLDSLDPTERAQVLAALIERCLLLGPSGIDAGVFMAAIHHGVRIARSPSSDGYRARMRSDVALRHAMIPLLERVIDEPDRN